MERIRGFFKTHRYHIGIVVVLLIAAAMRFYKLDSLPPGLHPDEAANGLDIFRILEKHDFQPFYPTNGGREALFFYLQAIGVKALGNTILALRVAPAAIGTLAVGAVYLLASNWFGRRVGWLAAALMAVTPWAVIISRDGFRAGMVALMVPLTLWLYTKAVQTGQRAWFIGAGVSLGAGFYTYISYRAFPLTLAIVLAAAYLWHRDKLKQWLPGIGISLIAMVVVLLPLGWYGVHHPMDIVGRSGAVSVLNPDLNHGNIPLTLGETVVKTALMFNVHGDNNYRQGYNGQPQLNIFVGIMFLLGVIICAVRFRALRYLVLLIVFGGMLAPEIATAEGIPHALRSIGSLPPTMILAALGIDYMLRQWHGVFPVNTTIRNAGTAAVAILLVLTAYQGYAEYFVAWANAPQTYQAYNEDSASLASYYNKDQFNGQRYALAGGYQMMPVEYLTHNHASYQLLANNDITTKNLDRSKPIEFSFFSGNKEKVLPLLEAKYPNGRLTPHLSTYNEHELFATYTIPAL